MLLFFYLLLTKKEGIMFFVRDYIKIKKELLEKENHSFNELEISNQ